MLVDVELLAIVVSLSFIIHQRQTRDKDSPKTKWFSHIFNYTTFCVYYTYKDTVYVFYGTVEREKVCAHLATAEMHMMMRVHSLLFTDQFVPSPLSNRKPLISLPYRGRQLSIG